MGNVPTYNFLLFFTHFEHIQMRDGYIFLIDGGVTVIKEFYKMLK